MLCALAVAWNQLAVGIALVADAWLVFHIVLPELKSALRVAAYESSIAANQYSTNSQQ